MLVRTVIGEYRPVAILLQAFGAFRTCTARIHHTAHTGQVASLEVPDFAADLHYPPDNLMPVHDGKSAIAPLVPHLMRVAMAHAAIKNLDLHVLQAGVATFEVEGPQWGFRIVSGIAVGFQHNWLWGGTG